MIKPIVERGMLKVICPKCNKIVDGELDYDFIHTNIGDDSVDITVKAFINCKECNTEIYAKSDEDYILLQGEEIL